MAGEHVYRRSSPWEKPMSGAVEDPELLGLVKLQNIAGFWKLDEVLSEHLTIPFHRLKASQPETWSSSSNEPVTDQIWGSAIVLAYLEARMPALAHEWEHMAKKGRAWLIEQTSTFEKSIPAAKKLVDELIVQAKPVVDLV
ncbi:unnamed protein product [Calicophoron daubneyi]|uniref:Glutathione S-transferase n=1 Tax=Calicophoron daubneyi TaxID=300641 RepID=A0AAV2TWU8_CALDB